MQMAVRLAAICLIAPLALLLTVTTSSRTIWGDPTAEAKVTGSLTVQIQPLRAQRDGARWRVDGGQWQKNGATVSGLSIGQHKVTFKTIAGWYTPEQEKVSIRGRQTTELAIAFERIETKLVTLPGDVPVEFVWIPAGSFMMGRTMNRRTGDYEEESVEDEDPRHRVTFENGFWMGKYELTQTQWVAVMGANPSYNTGDLQRPVEFVSWNSVAAFIDAMHALGHVGVHLPSEAEWEYACRAGTTTRYYWGNDPNYSQLGTYEWYDDNSDDASHPVGQKRPNPWGLYDMGGNVVEWCEDWFHSNYTGAPTDGSPWLTPATGVRVVRGGGYPRYNGACRSANRYYYPPQFPASGDVGFRLAIRSVPVAKFTVSPTTGPPPLDAQFTDQSLPGSTPITSWAWDFENDGVVDSTDQHPMHTYSSVGDYDVMLTVSGMSGSDTETKQALIDVFQVTAPTAAFSALPTSGPAPLDVQFSDESNPGSSPITSWAWDFENDGVVDSTEQNPMHTYLTEGDFNVTLAVASSFGGNALTREAYIKVGVLLLPGGVTLELVWIPAGSFLMGRYEDEYDSLNIEDPQHQVTFANGFWIGKYEVTQAQWMAVMGNNPSHFTGDLNRPVDNVSWNDAQNFIVALNALGHAVQLPSEAQWEYACRAGTATRLYWGDDLGYTELDTYAWHSGNSGSTTHPVGQKSPNAWGLYDMSGNLWEWCEDWYHIGYAGAPTDGSAWLSPTTIRVVRGGSWDSIGINHRSAFRSYSTPASAFNDIGFRLAK